MIGAMSRADLERASVLLALCLLVGAGCSSSDDGGEVLDPPGADTVLLHYDSDNLTSPFLAAATYEAAARFPSAETAAVDEGTLTEVRFYVADAPTSCRVRIYGADTSSSPGVLLYSADVTATVVPNSWNSHELQNPVAIPNDDLWISIEFTHAIPQSTIGCDDGPADADGNWLFASTDDSWITFEQRVGADINWNIRGVVSVPE